MRKEQDIENIRLEDQKKLNKIRAKADEIARGKLLSVKEKAEELKQKIQDLIDKKHDLFRAPYTKSETLMLAKDALKEGRRRWFVEGVLVPHLKDCQNRATSFLSDASLRVYLFSPEKAWKFVYSIITEDMIKEALKMLPDIGLSEKDREAQIKLLDEEITTLEAQIEGILKRV